MKKTTTRKSFEKQAFVIFHHQAPNLQAFSLSCSTTSTEARSIQTCSPRASNVRRSGWDCRESGYTI